MIAQSRTIDDIKRLYPDEWVLIDEPETDADLEVLAGVVVAHGPEADAVVGQARPLGLKRFAFLFMGEPRDDEWTTL